MPAPVKIPAEVIGVEKYSETVAQYIFKPLKRVPKFKPGQFLHLALDEYDPGSSWPESRVFSIASAANKRKEEIRILISTKGSFTKKMYHALHSGDQVWLKLPYGDFTFPEYSEREIVLIAGGTGISPYIAYLETCLEQNSKQKISLYYGIKEKTLFIFDNLLRACQEKMDNFELVVFAENSGSDNKYISGQIDLNHIIKKHSILDTDFYLSGPPQMIKTFRSKMIERGVSAGNIKIDNWE